MAVAALWLAAAATQGNAAGVVVSQTSSSHGPLELTMSDDGVRVDVMATEGSLLASTGIAINYRTATLTLLDFETSSFQSQPLASVLDARTADGKLAKTASSASFLEPEIGTPPRRKAKTPARLKRLRRPSTIGELTADGYVLVYGKTVRRLWYARAVAAPPQAIVQGAADALAAGGPRSVNRVLRKLAARLLLRLETRVGGVWRSDIDTTSAVRREVDPSVFSPPAGWSQAAEPIRFGGDRRGANPATTRVQASVAPGPGPVMRRPDVHVLYWGKVFNTPGGQRFVDRMNAVVYRVLDPLFGGQLSEYNVNVTAGRFVSQEVDNSDPPRTVGGSDFVSLGAKVLDPGNDLPKIWPVVGKHDPLAAIFVSEDDVNDSSWSGYHFDVISPAILIPWPFNMLTHDLQPWLVVKVPSDALNLPDGIDPESGIDGRKHRDCYGKALPANPARAGVCRALKAFDAASSRFAHEFTETVTDPYPFSGVIDPDKRPAYTEAEIADICRGESDAFLARRTGGVDVILSTYWSNEAFGCVPEALPVLRETYPCNEFEQTPCPTLELLDRGEQIVSWWAANELEGDVSYRVKWKLLAADSSEQSSGTGPAVLRDVPVGSYTLEARAPGVFDDRTRRWPVRVSALPPATIEIASPADGATVRRDQLFTLAGSAQAAIPVTRLVWRVNGVVVGSGERLRVRLSRSGPTAISLQAESGGAPLGEATRSVMVDDEFAGPSVEITSPADGEDVDVGGGPRTYSALATDASGAVVDNVTYQWTADHDGPLGTQASISVALSSCEVSSQFVTVVVRDPFGRTGSDTIRVYTCYVP